MVSNVTLVFSWCTLYLLVSFTPPYSPSYRLYWMLLGTAFFHEKVSTQSFLILQEQNIWQTYAIPCQEWFNLMLYIANLLQSLSVWTVDKHMQAKEQLFYFSDSYTWITHISPVRHLTHFSWFLIEWFEIFTWFRILSSSTSNEK